MRVPFHTRCGLVVGEGSWVMQNFRAWGQACEAPVQSAQGNLKYGSAQRGVSCYVLWGQLSAFRVSLAGCLVQLFKGLKGWINMTETPRLL